MFNYIEMNQDNPGHSDLRWTSGTKATTGGVVLQHGCIVPHLSKCLVQATHARHASTSSLQLAHAPLGLRGGIPRASWEANVVQGPCSPSPAPYSAITKISWPTFSDKCKQLQARARKYGTLTILFWNASTQAALPTPCSGRLL